MTYRKRRFFRPKCERHGCRKNAVCHVEHRKGYCIGTYCDECADIKIKSLEEYDAAVAQLTTGQDGSNG